jgi:predicted PurR-regulated permease PerM
MEDPASLESEQPQSLLRDRAGGIIATATVLALLYVGREVLVPITLAVILSLLIAPLVRMLRRVGLGQTVSVLLAVLALTVGFTATAVVIGTQAVKMAETIRHKLAIVTQLTVGRINELTGQAGRFISEPAGDASNAGGSSAPVAVEIHEPPNNALQVIQRVLASVWVPLETAGIVLVVLIFVLLEHEALRDRFIRIAGGTDIRATTLALNDAGERLSRFFVSQFAVNAGVAGALALALTLVGMPHALLWATMAGVLRFVPYVGVWLAAVFAAVMAAAVDPGWTLTISALCAFVIVELVAGQLVEPQLYGHTTGLSPLSVVIAAIFWSWLWGPIGLIVSTPLTLCLVVAGRHIKALSVLDILLGDNQALTMSQRFYQRALSGDSQEIIAGARDFLKRNSFASYCDAVLMPALYLARLDLQHNAISAVQLTSVRGAIVAVVEAIDGQARPIHARRPRESVLAGSTAAMLLRQQREKALGRWQGPLAVPPGSVMICVSLGSITDDLATELLVRVLRGQKIDARHVSFVELKSVPPLDASPDSVSAVCVVSAFPSEERQQADSVAADIRARFPAVCLVSVFLPGMILQTNSATDKMTGADKAATSIGHAVQICLDLQQEHSTPSQVSA